MVRQGPQEAPKATYPIIFHSLSKRHKLCVLLIIKIRIVVQGFYVITSRYTGQVEHN